MSFAQRAIQVQFALGQGDFGLEGMDVITLDGHRVQCHLEFAMPPSMGRLSLRIYGLTMSRMLQLCRVLQTADASMMLKFNKVSVSAGDVNTPLTRLFTGQILVAPINMEPPDAILEVQAFPGLWQQSGMAPASSFPSQVDLAEVLKTMAQSAGLGFENNGASAMAAKAYFTGSWREQIEAAARAAKFKWCIDQDVLSIWPEGGTRLPDPQLPLISPDTGMVGYPINSGYGITIKTQFNPTLRFGKVCRIRSFLPWANGDFYIFEITHDLESEMPDGQWFTTFTAQPRPGGEIYHPPGERF